MLFGGSIRFSTAALRSGEYPTSSSYPAHLRNKEKVEERTTSLTQGGLDTLAVIETTPNILIRKLVAHSDSPTEPSLEAFLPGADAEAEGDAFRLELIAVLDEQNSESLLPLETRCRRIRRLAEGKGPVSLDTLVGQRLSHEENLTYNEQPDPICRSIWTFLNFEAVFEDAEAFHAARQYRDFGRMYDAFEVDVDVATALDAASIDEEALAGRITALLELSSRCTVRSVNLPRTSAHPASVMLIVRHAGPLFSVYSHKDNGLKGTIYYRPPNEATLIWTPATRQMEICAQNPAVRQKVGAGFAEVVLHQDVSRKPLTWRRYDLSRFRNSLSLPIPQRDDCDILSAQLIGIELRLGTWSRRLALNVTINDDIELIAKRYLGTSDVFRRAEGFSRVSIAVKYIRSGRSTESSLNLEIGHSRSNLHSKHDPEERDMGYALLDFWGILNAFKQLEDYEARNILPQLLGLYDLPEDEVTGGFIREQGLDAQRLIKAGIIELRGRQSVVLIDEDDDFGEVRLNGPTSNGSISATGLHGEILGKMPVDDVLRFALKRDWLDETILKLVKPSISRPSITSLDDDLIYLGKMKLEHGEVPVHLARRLSHSDTVQRLDVILRGRQGIGTGLVLSAGQTSLNHLGPNVVVKMIDHLDENEPGVLSRGSLEQAYHGGRTRAMPESW